MFRCTSWYLIHTHTAIIWSNVSDTFLSAGREETDMCALEVNIKILPIVSSIMSWLVCHAHLMFQHAFTVRDWLPITRFHEWQRATDNAKWYSVETIWNFFIVVSEWCGGRELLTWSMLGFSGFPLIADLSWHLSRGTPL